MIFWETVKLEIKKQNTTQEWLSKEANISYDTIRSWISKGILPRVDKAFAIANALDTSLDYLTTGVYPTDNIQSLNSNQGSEKLKQIIDLLPEEKINDLIRLAEGWIPELKRKENLA